MADNTKIEWADASWNPIRARNRETGKIGHYCEHLSPGCVHCYSETFNRRGIGAGVAFQRQNRDKVELFLDETMLTQPLRWKKPRRIFPCSMTDLFADFVPDEWIDRIFAVMALCPQHTFTLLTKRAERMRRYLSLARAHPVGLAALEQTLNSMAKNPRSKVGEGCVLQGDIPHLKVWPLPNVWLGVSVEDQPRANERIPHLWATPAARRFISAEPLLGPIDLTQIDLGNGAYLDALDGGMYMELPRGWRPAHPIPGAVRLDWVITGGESGPNARPMHPDWARSLRDQCVTAQVPFFFKQWGDWRGDDKHDLRFTPDNTRDCHIWPDAAAAYLVGKRAAGRLLDGVEWSEMPI